MNLLRVLIRCILVAQLVFVCGCASSRQTDTIKYTDFEKIDIFRDEKIEFKGKHIVVGRLKLRPNDEKPGEFNDYVWILKTSVNHDPRTEYQRLGSKKYQLAFNNLPIKDIDNFFREAVSRHLKSGGDNEEKIAIDVKKISLATSSIGMEKYRVCTITIGTAANGNEIETTSEIKLAGSSTRFYKTSSYSTVSYSFDPEGLDVVEMAFVDALQQGLSLLIK